MWQFMTQLFTSDFMPHGHCFLWRPEILWLHVGSDLIIALSYYSIPLALIFLVSRREDLAYNWMFGMFAAFIFACGTTHLMDIWTVWHGTYRLEGVVKLFTACISIVTAMLLWPLVRKALELPSMEQLENEIHERSKAEEELRHAHASLEKRVAERTHELQDSNAALVEKTQKLERFHKITVNRELELSRLKREINSLLGELGRSARYELSTHHQFEDESKSRGL